jgi:hypothetical protein
VIDAIKRNLVADMRVNPRDYELDHIAPLDLGGAPLDLRNLMLQPWARARNAHMKDDLEGRLSTMVCSGDLILKGAQHDFATDWRAVYKKRVNGNHFAFGCAVTRSHRIGVVRVGEIVLFRSPWNDIDHGYLRALPARSSANKRRRLGRADRTKTLSPSDAPGTLGQSPFLLQWEEPHFSHYLSRVTSLSRLIIFDKAWDRTLGS